MLLDSALDSIRTAVGMVDERWLRHGHPDLAWIRLILVLAKAMGDFVEMINPSR